MKQPLVVDEDDDEDCGGLRGVLTLILIGALVLGTIAGITVMAVMMKSSGDNINNSSYAGDIINCPSAPPSPCVCPAGQVPFFSVIYAHTHGLALMVPHYSWSCIDGSTLLMVLH